MSCHVKTICICTRSQKINLALEALRIETMAEKSQQISVNPVASDNIHKHLCKVELELNKNWKANWGFITMRGQEVCF